MVSFVENLSDKFPILYQNRYCDQEDFNIALFDGDNDFNNVSFDKPFLFNNFDAKVYLPTLLNQKYACKVIASGSDIYLLDDFSDTPSVKLYSSSTKSWKCIPPMIEQKLNYCVCSFMQKLFVIGGKDTYNKFDRKDTCKFYDKQSDS